jgi:hypothetical protein
MGVRGFGLKSPFISWTHARAGNLLLRIWCKEEEDDDDDDDDEGFSSGIRGEENGMMIVNDR